MPQSKKPSAVSGAAIGSASSTISGPANGPDDDAIDALKQPSVQALARRNAAAQALAKALPDAAHKREDHGLQRGHVPAEGQVAVAPGDATGASTLSEENVSPKLGDRVPVRGFNASQGPLDNARVDSGGQAITTNQGVLVGDNQNSLKAGLRGPTLLEDFILREKITHFDHERIPERVVHARGSGAHGYFECDVALDDLTRAAPFAVAGKRTPVFVRFSTVAGERGSADTARDVRGFAVKFYTDEGNWDLVGNNIPVFFIQDAMKFPDLVHSFKPEPHHGVPQASTAHDTFWDFVSLSPESVHMLMWAMSDRAIPRSYRMMQGFGVHSFRFVNEAGASTFVKFHWTPVAGTHSLVWDEAVKIAGADPDFHRRDLWEAIEAGNYPEWTLGVQVFSEEQAAAFTFDVLDPTKIVPEELVPVRPVGRLVLDRNPDNFFAETEQVAFCTAHVVPGIDFSNDPLLQGRIHSYVDTQLTRLGGPNFHEIPINAPVVEVHNNQRDAMHRRAIPRGRVAYEPNSLGGGCPFQAGARGFVSFPQPVQEDKVRGKPEKFADHYSQATLFWRSQSPTEQDHIVAAYRFELTRVQVPAIRERMVSVLRNVDEGLARRVADGLGIELPTAQPRVLEPPVTSEIETSPALSLRHFPGDGSARGLRVALLVADGVEGASLRAIYDALAHAQAAPRFVGVRLGKVTCDGGEKIEVEATLETMPSALWDAVVLPVGALADARLADVGQAVEFIKDQYRHCKPMLALGSESLLLEAGGRRDGRGRRAGRPGHRAARCGAALGAGRRRRRRRRQSRGRADDARPGPLEARYGPGGAGFPAGAREAQALRARARPGAGLTPAARADQRGAFKGRRPIFIAFAATIAAGTSSAAPTASRAKSTISPCTRCAARSHVQLCTAINASMRRCRRRGPRSQSADRQASTKVSASPASRTTWPYSATMSCTGVAITGFWPARYSSVCCGLAQRVDSSHFSGSRQASQCACRCGRIARVCGPTQWTFERCGNEAASMPTTGPAITRCQSGRASAIAAMSARSSRSSMVPNQPRRGFGMAAWIERAETASIDEPAVATGAK
jgi:catalase